MGIGLCLPLEVHCLTKEIISIELNSSMIYFNLLLIRGPLLLTKPHMKYWVSLEAHKAHKREGLGGLDNGDKKWHFFFFQTEPLRVWYQLLELAGPLIRGHLHPAGRKDKLEPLSVHYRKKKKELLQKALDREFLSTRREVMSMTSMGRQNSKWNFRTKWRSSENRATFTFQWCEHGG